MPRGLVAHADGALELVGTNALLGLYNEVEGEKPFPQGKVRVMEDGPGSNREAVAA